MGLGEELQRRRIRDGLEEDPELIAERERLLEEEWEKEVATWKPQETKLIGMTKEIREAIDKQEQEEQRKQDIVKIAMKLAQRSGFSYAVREFLSLS